MIEYFIRVLIPVLMEDTLRVMTTHNPNEYYVLILVLMEDSLRAH